MHVDMHVRTIGCMTQELETQGPGISDQQMMQLREAVRGHVLDRLRCLDNDMDDLIEEVRVAEPKAIPAMLRMKLAVLRDLADVAGLRGFRAPPKLPEPEPDAVELARMEQERLQAAEQEALERAAVVDAARLRVVQALGG